MVLHLPPSTRFSIASDHSLLVTFGNEISPESQADVLHLTNLLLQQSLKGILNIHPAYSTVLITVDPGIITPSATEEYVRRIYESTTSTRLPQPRSLELPVCYDPEFGPDLGVVRSEEH